MSVIATRGRRRLRRVLLVVAAAVLVAFTAATAWLFVWPPTNRPHRADAILSLNGDNEGARERKALSLAEDGYAPVLLFSQGNSYTTPCPTASRVRVVCFEPRPARTIGEIEFAVDYARRHGWHNLLVVAGQTQASRARLLMDRCFTGRTQVVDVAVPTSEIPFQIVYGWGALIRAVLIDPGC